MMWLSPQTLFMLFYYAAAYKSLPRCCRRGVLEGGRLSQRAVFLKVHQCGRCLWPQGEIITSTATRGQAGLTLTPHANVDMLKPNFCRLLECLPHRHLSLCFCSNCHRVASLKKNKQAKDPVNWGQTESLKTLYGNSWKGFIHVGASIALKTPLFCWFSVGRQTGIYHITTQNVINSIFHLSDSKCSYSFHKQRAPNNSCWSTCWFFQIFKYIYIHIFKSKLNGPYAAQLFNLATEPEEIIYIGSKW